MLLIYACFFRWNQRYKDKSDIFSLISIWLGNKDFLLWIATRDWESSTNVEGGHKRWRLAIKPPSLINLYPRSIHLCTACEVYTFVRHICLQKSIFHRYYANTLRSLWVYLCDSETHEHSANSSTRTAFHTSDSRTRNCLGSEHFQHGSTH